MVKKISRRIDLTENNLFSKDDFNTSIYYIKLNSKEITKKIPNWLNKNLRKVNSDIELYLSDKCNSIYWKAKEQFDNFNLNNKELYHCHYCGRRLPLWIYGLCKKCDRKFGLSQNNKTYFEAFL